MNKQGAPAEAGPNPIDLHVGLRLRLRRKALGISQERLAESVGLTFQQIQKYERAANRVSASKLWELALALNTHVGFFYEGLGDEPETAAATEQLLSADAVEVARLLSRVQRPGVRRQIVELVRALAS